MCPYDREIEKIREQIIRKYNPDDIILFGSCAKGRVSRSSDAVIEDILIQLSISVGFSNSKIKPLKAAQIN